MRWPWKTKTQILLEEVEYLRAQVAQLQNYVLLAAPTAMAAIQPPPEASTAGPDVVHQLHVSDLQADLDYQLQEGLIDEQEWIRRMDSLSTDTIEFE
jgi:hypothetical protein